MAHGFRLLPHVSWNLQLGTWNLSHSSGGTPVRLGIFDIHQVDPIDPDDSAAVYRRRLDHLALADDLGFDVAFTAERHFMTGYRCPAPGVWIGAASQRTKRMRLGILAYTLPLHLPAALAEEITVLDHLAGG